MPKTARDDYAVGMCMLLIGQKVHPEYKLILAANRDEDLRRPTEEAHWRGIRPRILAGRDITAGGTWLGLSEGGRIAALTNYWGDMEPYSDAPSRGGLVAGFLRSGLSAAEYVRRLDGRSEGPGRSRYNGFNLIMGDADELWYYTNAENVKNPGSDFRPPAVGEAQRLSPGLHVISNAVLDTPWPKAVQAEGLLKDLIQSGRLTPHTLMELLNTCEDAGRQRDPALPHEQARELAKASIRIQFPRFATRSSTVVLVDYKNRVRFIEKSYFPARVNDFSFSSTV